MHVENITSDRSFTVSDIRGVRDWRRVKVRLVDGILYKSYSQAVLLEFNYSGKPNISLHYLALICDIAWLSSHVDLDWTGYNYPTWKM